MLLLRQRLQLTDRRIIAKAVAHLNQTKIHRVFIRISRLSFGLTQAWLLEFAGAKTNYLVGSGDGFEIGPFFPANLLFARLARKIEITALRRAIRAAIFPARKR